MKENLRKDLQKAFESLDVANRERLLESVGAKTVVHGHWVEEGNCSICKMPIPTDNIFDYLAVDDVHYCPNCGAKMDEVEE